MGDTNSTTQLFAAMDGAPPLGPEPTNSSLRQKRAAAVSTRKLAPLDHIRTLYSGARHVASQNGGQRKVFEKQELVGAVRRMSPLRNPSRHLTQQIFKESEAFTESRTEGKLNTGDTELRLLQDNLNNSTRRYNTLKSQADQEQSQLQSLLDKLGQLEYEVNALKELEDNATPDAQRLKKLKQREETVGRQIESKLRYQHQLDHMVETLEEDYVKVDAHIKTMNDALSASRREFESIKTLMRQLYNARDKALKDLQERKQMLEQRRQEAYAAERMEEWRKQQEAMRLELAAELRGEMSKEEEERLMSRLVQKQKQSEELQQETAVKTREALTLQEAFLKIRQATGVATLEEMVDKFLGQDANKHSLEQEKAHVEQQLAKAKAEKEKMEGQFADLKASGVGGTELSREMYDKLDHKISRAKASLRVNKASAERLESVLVAVRQGALGLSQRLSPYGHLLTSQARLELPHTGIEALDLLLHCEALLWKLVQAIRRKQQEAKKQKQMARAGAAERSAASPPPGRRSRGGSRPSTPISGRQSPASARSGASALMTPTLEVPEDTEVAAVNVRVPPQRVGQDAGQWVDVGAATEPGEAEEDEEAEAEEEELNEAARREMKVQARKKVQQEETRAEAQRKAAEAEKEGKTPSKPSAKARKAQQLHYMSKLSSSVASPVSHPVPAPTSPDIQPKSATFLTQ